MNIYKMSLLLLFLSISVFAMDEKKQATLGLFKAIKKGCSLEHIKKMIDDPNVNLSLSIHFALRSYYVPYTFLECVYDMKRADITKYLFENKKINPFIAISSSGKSPGVRMLLEHDRIFDPLITDYIKKNIDKETGVMVIKDLIDYGDPLAITTVLENIKNPTLKFNIVNSSDKNGEPLLSVAVKKYIRMKTQKESRKQEQTKDIINNLLNSGAQFGKLNQEGKSTLDLVKEKAPDLLPIFNKDTSMPDATA